MEEHLKEIFAREDARREHDAVRYKELDDDLCQLCHAHGGDKRSLHISCLYAIHEVVPEAIDLWACDPSGQGYYLRICKACRGRLLDMLSFWRDECVNLRAVPKDEDGNIEQEGDIPVRINGRIVMMTEEQYDTYKESDK